MVKTQQQLSIFLIETSGIAVFTSQTQTSASFPFPNQVIQDMSIAKHDDFHSFIAQISQAQKLAGHHLIAVLGKTLIFEKQVPLLTEEKLQEELKVFRHSAPFDRVAAKVYKTPTTNTIVAINRDFFDSLKQSLERQSITVVAVLPQFVFMQLLGKQQLSDKVLQTLLSKEDSIAEQSLVMQRSTPKTLQEQEEYLSKKYSGLIVVAFVGFILLVLAVTGLILRSQFQSVKTPKVTPVSTMLPSAQTSEREIAVSSEKESTASALFISIFSGPQGASASARLAAKLREQGFIQVTNRSQAGITVTKPLVLIKPSVPNSLRTQIAEILRGIVADFSIQENTELDEDISITLGE